MSLQNKSIRKIVRLNAGDAEWDGGTDFVCIYIEPIEPIADFCAEGYDVNADHTLSAAYTSANDTQVVRSQASGGEYTKVHISSTSASGIKLYLVALNV